jgi:hypothetical protein
MGFRNKTRRKTRNKSEHCKNDDLGMIEGGGIIYVTHSSGFFSCCSIRLEKIIDYFNSNKSLPTEVNSSKQFELYKNTDKSKNITFDYFEHYNNEDVIKYKKYVDYDHNKQFTNYKTLDYKEICPFVRKYFKPSNTIQDIIKIIEKKYIKTKFSDICTMFYRGNDKVTETAIPSHEMYIEKAKIILIKNPKVQFLIQSDETEFIEKITTAFPKNSFYFKDEIRHMTKRMNTVNSVFKDKNVEFSKKFLAITIIMSKTKYLICNAGNCSLWIMLYRENADNLYEFFNGSWV